MGMGAGLAVSGAGERIVTYAEDSQTFNYRGYEFFGNLCCRSKLTFQTSIIHSSDLSDTCRMVFRPERQVFRGRSLKAIDLNAELKITAGDPIAKLQLYSREKPTANGM